MVSAIRKIMTRDSQPSHGSPNARTRRTNAGLQRHNPTWTPQVGKREHELAQARSHWSAHESRAMLSHPAPALARAAQTRAPTVRALSERAREPARGRSLSLTKLVSECWTSLSTCVR